MERGTLFYSTLFTTKCFPSVSFTLPELPRKQIRVEEPTELELLEKEEREAEENEKEKEKKKKGKAKGREKDKGKLQEEERKEEIKNIEESTDLPPDPKIDKLRQLDTILLSSLIDQIQIIDKMYFYYNNSLRSTQIFNQAKLLRKRLKQIEKMDILSTLFFPLTIELSSEKSTYAKQQWDAQLYRLRICSYFIQCLAEELAKGAVPIQTSVMNNHHSQFCIIVLSIFSSLFADLNALEQALAFFYNSVKEKVQSLSVKSMKEPQLLKYLSLVSQLGPLPLSVESIDFYAVVKEKKLHEFSPLLKKETKADKMDKTSKNNKKKNIAIKGKKNNNDKQGKKDKNINQGKNNIEKRGEQRNNFTTPPKQIMKNNNMHKSDKKFTPKIDRNKNKNTNKNTPNSNNYKNTPKRKFEQQNNERNNSNNSNKKKKVEKEEEEDMANRPLFFVDKSRSKVKI